MHKLMRSCHLTLSATRKPYHWNENHQYHSNLYGGSNTTVSKVSSSTGRSVKSAVKSGARSGSTSEAVKSSGRQRVQNRPNPNVGSNTARKCNRGHGTQTINSAFVLAYPIARIDHESVRQSHPFLSLCSVTIPTICATSNPKISQATNKAIITQITTQPLPLERSEETYTEHTSL